MFLVIVGSPSPLSLWGMQQKLDNISDAVIAEYYSRIQSEGFNTLSYWNVFEFGQDIVYVLCVRSTTATTCVWILVLRQRGVRACLRMLPQIIFKSFIHSFFQVLHARVCLSVATCAGTPTPPPPCRQHPRLTTGKTRVSFLRHGCAVRCSPTAATKV